MLKISLQKEIDAGQEKKPGLIAPGQVTLICSHANENGHLVVQWEVKSASVVLLAG